MRLHRPQCWLRAGAIALSLGVGNSTRAADDWQPPLTVDNPFFTSPSATAAVESEDDGRSVLGDDGIDEFEGELPPVYRLPAVECSGDELENTIPDGDPDICPEPVDPSPEMLRDLEEIWAHPFAGEPEPALNSGGHIPYTPTADGLSTKLLPSVRKAYALAQRGALYAAQAEFVQVLRHIAQANDAAHGTDHHSKALAAGLRALDEADDFAPGGVQLEAEMNVGVVASSHRTPALRGQLPTALPHDAISLYHQYAQRQLALAAAGEQAGSMALYGLGKMQCRIANDSDRALRHEQKAVTLFLAALDASPDNHLAANEVGVLLTRGGHPDEASQMFKRAIDVAPTSAAYHNLAVVEQKMGQHEESAANEQYAQQLAARDRAAGAVSRSKGVQWVSPQELARVTSGEPTPQPPGPQLSNAPQSAGTVARWPQKLVPNVFRR